MNIYRYTILKDSLLGAVNGGDRGGGEPPVPGPNPEPPQFRRRRIPAGPLEGTLLPPLGRTPVGR